MKVKSFTVTVEVPMHRRLILVSIYKSRNNIQQWEDIFRSLRDDEEVYECKRNYDICRALLKYAYAESGELNELSNGKNCLIFTLNFDKIEALNTFVKNLNRAVEGATI